jgi:hypothetical protein
MLKPIFVTVQTDVKAFAGLLEGAAGVVLQYGPVLLPMVSPSAQHDIGIALNVAGAITWLYSKFAVSIKTQPESSPPSPVASL